MRLSRGFATFVISFDFAQDRLHLTMNGIA
jgi:hypothetical protein